MGRKFPGIYQHDDGRWWVDKVVGGRRLQKAFGADYSEAEEWLLQQLARIRATREGDRPRFTFEEAACRYIREHESKPSLEDEILYLKLAMPYVGALFLDEICDETLEPLVSALKAPVVTQAQETGLRRTRVRKNKTVNLVLGTIRQVLNLAARKWRVEGNRRLTWLGQAPLITMLDLEDARSPKPITLGAATCSTAAPVGSHRPRWRCSCSTPARATRRFAVCDGNGKFVRRSCATRSSWSPRTR